MLVTTAEMNGLRASTNCMTMGDSVQEHFSTALSVTLIRQSDCKLH